jgi:hypothetical protein
MTTATTAQLHPDPAVDHVWSLGLTSRSPLICSAGRTGFYIDGNGDYWKCGAVAPVTAPIGNILRDGELRFAKSAVCERFPTQQPNSGSEIQCWCVENQVLDVTRASTDEMKGLYDQAFVHIDVSRICNFSCHYCTVPKPIFDGRKLVNKREALPPWAHKPYLDKADITVIANAIFAKCSNVTIRLAGLMEPLMNPDILTFFEIAKQNEGKLKEMRLMSNLGIEKTFDDILEMDFGQKLNTMVSMHITDDNFDPFRVVRQIKKAEQHGIRIKSHIIPSPLVHRHMVDYLDFFSIHGVRVRPVPYIVEDPSGHALEKNTQSEVKPPKHLKWVQEFLGSDFAGRLKGKSYAQYIEQIRSLNADSYQVAQAFTTDEGDSAKQSIYTLKSGRATIPIVVERAAPAEAAQRTPPTPATGDDARKSPPQTPTASSLPTSPELRRQAYAAIAAGRPEEAFALLEAALSAAPNDHEVLCDLATLALTHAEFEPAIEFARRAIEVSTSHGPSRYVMAMALAGSGARVEAIDIFEALQADAESGLNETSSGLAEAVATELRKLQITEAQPVLA